MLKTYNHVLHHDSDNRIGNDLDGPSKFDRYRVFSEIGTEFFYGSSIFERNLNSAVYKTSSIVQGYWTNTGWEEYREPYYIFFSLGYIIGDLG